MSKLHYAKTITVSAPVHSAYRALTEGFEHWWTKPDRNIVNTGDRAKFTFPPGASFWTFEATRLLPDIYVELKCVDALHIHQGQAKEIELEWLGTKVIWRIEEIKSQTHIHFEHIGLNPDLLCYDICQAGWDFFFLESLKKYLDSGSGTPHIAD